jgi:hypothetical protein
MTSKQPKPGFLDAKRRAHLLDTYRRDFPIELTGHSTENLRSKAYQALEKLELAALQASQPNSTYAVSLTPIDAALILHAQSHLQRDALTFLHQDEFMDQIDLASRDACQEATRVLEEYRASQPPDCKVSMRELDLWKTMYCNSEEGRNKILDHWKEAAQLAGKAEEIAREIGSLYHSHMAVCGIEFINQLYQQICETDKNWRSIPEKVKKDRINSAIKGLLKDRERARQERSYHEQKLMVQERTITQRQDEINRLREEADTSHRKYKEDLANAQKRFDAEHSKRFQQERQIEDIWSRKVLKRNTKINDLENEIIALKRNSESLNQVEATTTPKIPDESAALANAETKIATMKERMRNGSKKYKALLDEKEGLETKLKERELDVNSQQKLILSLRSSEHSVQDQLEKARHQVTVQKDAEIASVQASLAEQVARNEALEEELKELRRQRQVHGTMVQGLNRRLNDRNSME